jgi:two-component system sensor histidine kinase DegS
MMHATQLWPLIRERVLDRRFWMVQALVIVIAAVHTTVESLGTIHGMGDLYLIPISLFVMPILYAAFTFGFEGALATGLWCALLTVPPLVQFHNRGERIEIVVQLAFLMLLGVIVAIRVDQERRAKLAAEDANRRLADSQASLNNFIGLGLRAQEDERLRLSRGLHDETVQELLVAKTALEHVIGAQGERARLEFVDAALQRSIEGIRRLCRALRPSVLDDLGLVPALDWLLADLAGRTEIQIALETPGDRPLLNPEQELVIFRVAQQALHNIERHAHASRVVVRLASDPGRLCLDVSDDGCGFDPTHVRQGGLGMAGMQERARLIGATFDISSRPGSTRVRLDLRPESGPAVADSGSATVRAHSGVLQFAGTQASEKSFPEPAYLESRPAIRARTEPV